MKLETAQHLNPKVVEDIDQQPVISTQEIRQNYLSSTESGLLIPKSMSKAKKPSSRYHNPIRRKTVICYHWKRGRCQLGNDCNFIHPDVDNVSMYMNNEVVNNIEAVKDISCDSSYSECHKEMRSDEDSLHDRDPARVAMYPKHTRQINCLPSMEPIYFGYTAPIPTVQHLPPFLGHNRYHQQLPYSVQSNVPHYLSNSSSGLTYYNNPHLTGCYPNVYTYQPGPYLHL